MSSLSIQAAALVAGCALLVSGNGYAHARLLSAQPAANAVLTAPPKQIRLAFSERIEPKLSGVLLTDSTGHKLALGLPASEPQNGKAFTVRIHSVLGAGLYTVSWRVVASDTHKTQGKYQFSVKAH